VLLGYRVGHRGVGEVDSEGDGGMSKTSIEWTDHSLNPFRARNKETGKVGHWCEKISPGCKNCYASKLQSPYLTQLEYVASNRDKVELFLYESVLHEVLRRKKPTRFFWCDMTDMLLADYPDEWIDQCSAVMALTPHHTHQILTKRPERLLALMTRGVDDEWMRDHLDEVAAKHFECCHADMNRPERWPLPNVHLGVSVENQEQKQRVELLRQTPAALRFLSLEPLLEDLGELELTGIGWVIVGGESGPGARPCNLAWIRGILDQCRAAGVPCFVKQGGAKPFDMEWTDPGHLGPQAPFYCEWNNRKGGDPSEWPEWMRVREMPR
jgi:protein gp37